MYESKIDLTDRLRRDGRWAGASRFKDETVRRLRAEGMKRAEAGEQAWQQMAEAFPPPPSAEQAPEAAAGSAVAKVTQLLCDVAEGEVDQWQQKYGVTLPNDARDALVGEELVYFWAMGLMGEIPGSCVPHEDAVTTDAVP